MGWVSPGQGEDAVLVRARVQGHDRSFMILLDGEPDSDDIVFEDEKDLRDFLRTLTEQLDAGDLPWEDDLLNAGGGDG